MPITLILSESEVLSVSKIEALNDVQRKLVSDHIHIVEWAIYDYIEVNENLYGFGYDDLFQEGCICLCKAAATYDSESAQFITYAQVVVRNGLLTYCKKMCKIQKPLINLSDVPLDPEDGDGETYADHFPDEDVFATLVSCIDILGLLESVKPEYNGIARLGIEALELKVKGYSGAEIARLWGVEQNHVGAWISRAKKKLRNNERFVMGLK